MRERHGGGVVVIGLFFVLRICAGIALKLARAEVRSSPLTWTELPKWS